MDIDCGITVIGAGSIGLATASALSERERDIYILEMNRTHGRGISSRNSEVVHAGIYYPPGSLKSRFCIEGKDLLYETCARQNIPYARTGKLIIARTEAEQATLENLKANAEHCGVASLSVVNKAQLLAMEPNVRAVGGLLSPDTGIVNVHLLMDYYLQNAKRHGADIAYGTTVKGIERVHGGYRITTADEAGEQFQFVTERVVNAAGLYADEIAGMLGERYSHYYCKGDYFSVSNVPRGMVKRLIYPVPEANHVGLGVHVTLDLSGRMRLGPDAVYVGKQEDYRVDAAKREAFYESAVTFLPFLKKEHISPEMSGIRPKLQGPGDTFRDFVISEDHPGFVNLVGIESPGLTAAPAIARHIGTLVTTAKAAA